jgi:hypothetical protein
MQTAFLQLKLMIGSFHEFTLINVKWGKKIYGEQNISDAHL